MARTPWHPAGFQAFENEFEDWRNDLEIVAEYQLTSEPLKMDILIIKKTRDVVITKNIGRIFRQFNIIEFKSPSDRVAIADYDKVHAYARAYASLNDVRTENLSVTVSSVRHPRKLLDYLRKKKNFNVWQEQPGIYIVEGEVYPTQIIVTSELSEKNNFWLVNLRNDLTPEQMAKVLGTAADKPNIDAYLHAITNANPETLEELFMRKKEGVIFTEKLDAYLTERYGDTWTAKDIAEGLVKGKAKDRTEGIAEGKTEAILAVLQARFNNIPKGVERSISKTNDLTALGSLVVQAATCQSIDEFAKKLK